MKKTKFKTSELPVFFFNPTTLEVTEKLKNSEEGHFENHIFENFGEFVDKTKYVDMVVMHPHMRSFESLDDGRVKFFGSFYTKETRTTSIVY
jgi:hypothetical protein